MTNEDTPIPGPLNNVIRIDDERIKGHLDRVVRGTVEETLNSLLDAEADRLCNAQRYERTEARRDTRAGHYERSLETKAGEVTLKVPKLRRQTFETAIIERYRRREASVEEALIEMYLAGVSVRRVEDITEALWGTRVSPSTVSDLNKKIYATIEQWRNRPIESEHPYVYLDGIVMKRTWAGARRFVVVAGGYRLHDIKEPSPLEDTTCFSQGLCGVRHVVQAVGEGDHFELDVGPRQRIAGAHVEIHFHALLGRRLARR
jgi:hypothetical protein